MYQYPFKGRFEFGTSFGKKGSLWKCGYHTGLDLKSSNYGGDGFVYPIADGIVQQISTAGAYGNHIYVRHDDGYISLYAHLCKTVVKEGQRVATNTVLGIEGCTGNATGVHLHLEVHQGEYSYPASIDPREFLEEQLRGDNMANYYIEKIKPERFDIVHLGKAKTKGEQENYFNLDYFGGSPMYSVCNLAAGGKVISQTATLKGANTAGKKQTTLIVTAEGGAYMYKTDRLDSIGNLRCAIGGVPFMINGKEVSLSKDIKTEGWSGGNFYKTWHGFLTVQDGDIWYIAANTGHSNDVTATTVIWEFLKSLGCTGTVIKLDGGGSFIYKKNGQTVKATAEDRVINYIGTFSRQTVLGGYDADDLVTYGELDRILKGAAGK